MSALDTWYIDYVESTDVSKIYNVINYHLLYKKYIREHWTEPTETWLRNSPSAMFWSYNNPTNRKLIGWYIQALKHNRMNRVKLLIEQSRNTDNSILLLEGSNIKPMIIWNWVLGFNGNKYGKGEGVWIYHFIQDNIYYRVTSKPLTTHTDSEILYHNHLWDIILRDPSLARLPDFQIVTDVDDTIYWTWVDSEKYKIIKQSFDDFVKQINKMTKTKS